MTSETARWPQHVESGHDHVRLDDADGVDEPIDIEMARVGPRLKQLHLSEVDRRGEANQIFERSMRMQRRIDGRQNATHSVADEGHVLDV